MIVKLEESFQLYDTWTDPEHGVEVWMTWFGFWTDAMVLPPNL